MTLLAAFTIVAFGDSTTAKRDELEVYSGTLSRELRIDGAPVQVINAGIPKNNTADARKRFQTDVLDKNPQAVIIQFGINDSAVDVWENPPKTESRVSLSDFSDNLEYFITTARERGIRVILMLTAGDSHYLCHSDDEIREVTKVACEQARGMAYLICADRNHGTSASC